MKKLIACRNCSSRSHVKAGKAPNGKQLYKCKECGCRFIQWTPSYKLQYSLKVISLAVYLHRIKQSYRLVARMINDKFNLKVAFETIKYWVAKFSDVTKEFIDSKKLQFSGLWHMDEVFFIWGNRDPIQKHKIIKIDKHYTWNLMDASSRYLAYPEHSMERTKDPAIKLIKRVSKQVTGPPQQIVTDGLAAYPQAFRKTVYRQNPKLKHSKFVMIKGERGNNLIERFHRTLRERTKLYYGFRPKGNSIKLLNLDYTFYNFLRPHSGIANKTPAEMLGLDLKLSHDETGLYKLVCLALKYVHRKLLKDKKKTSFSGSDSNIGPVSY